MSTRIGDYLFGRIDKTPPASEERALQVTPWGDWGGSYSTGSGRAVTPRSSEQLLAVYGCAQLISDTIATLPRQVFSDSPDRTPVSSPPPWFKQPNEYNNMTELVAQAMWSFLFDGNVFLGYGVDRSLRVNELTILDPTRVDIRYEPPGSAQVRTYVDGKLFTGRMKHVKGLTRPGALRGISPVEAARQSISIGLEAQDFASRFYRNGAHLSGVIESPRDFTLPQAKDLLDKFGRDHSGDRSHKPGLLDGDAKWRPISITPEQAQFLESRKYQSSEIAGQMFLLDPTLLGIPVDTHNLTYANLEQRGIHMVTFTLLRWLVRLEELFSDLLPANQYMKFNVNGLMRADLKTRAEVHQMALGGPLGTGQRWMTVEEVRKLEELGPEPAELKKANAMTAAPTQPPRLPNTPASSPAANGNTPKPVPAN